MNTKSIMMTKVYKNTFANLMLEEYGDHGYCYYWVVEGAESTSYDNINDAIDGLNFGLTLFPAQ